MYVCKCKNQYFVGSRKHPVKLYYAPVIRPFSQYLQNVELVGCAFTCNIATEVGLTKVYRQIIADKPDVCCPALLSG